MLNWNDLCLYFLFIAPSKLPSASLRCLALSDRRLTDLIAKTYALGQQIKRQRNKFIDFGSYFCVCGYSGSLRVLFYGSFWDFYCWPRAHTSTSNVKGETLQLGQSLPPALSTIPWLIDEGRTRAGQLINNSLSSLKSHKSKSKG